MVNIAATSRGPESSSATPENHLPIVESLNNEETVNHAHELAKRRIIHYEGIINSNRHLPTDNKFFTEERITLRVTLKLFF
ncbi:hypothetical protein GCK32_007392, partial [Trichostrongylus colubriformis]